MSNQPSQTVIAAAIDATARILAGQKEAFDPESETDRAWWSATFEFILTTANPVKEPEGYVEAFPGAEVVQLPEGPPGMVMPFPQPQGPPPQPAAQYPPAPQSQQWGAPPQSVPQAYPQPQAMPWGAPPPPQQPQQGFGGPATDEEHWGMLIREMQSGGGQLQNWYDNRNNKRSPTSPDFRHKTMPDPRNGQRKVGLYLNRAPAWALQALQQFPPR